MVRHSPVDGTRVPLAMTELLSVLPHSQSWCLLCSFSVFMTSLPIEQLQSVIIYLIILLTHCRKSQSAQDCRLMLSVSKMPEEILTKPKQSRARLSQWSKLRQMGWNKTPTKHKRFPKHLSDICHRTALIFPWCTLVLHYISTDFSNI